MVHGDDFVSTGTREAATQFKRQLENRFEIKTQMLGSDGVADSARTSAPGTEDQVAAEGRVLNRVVRWTPEGWEVEPDQRHADLIVQELN